MNSHRPEILLVFHFFPSSTPLHAVFFSGCNAEVRMWKTSTPKKKEKEEEKLAARECLMAAVSPLENSQVECELFRMCG